MIWWYKLTLTTAQTIYQVNCRILINLIYRLNYPGALKISKSPNPNPQKTGYSIKYGNKAGRKQITRSGRYETSSIQVGSVGTMKRWRTQWIPLKHGWRSSRRKTSLQTWESMSSMRRWDWWQKSRKQILLWRRECKNRFTRSKLRRTALPFGDKNKTMRRQGWRRKRQLSWTWPSSMKNSSRRKWCNLLLRQCRSNSSTRPHVTSAKTWREGWKT